MKSGFEIGSLELETHLTTSTFVSPAAPGLFLAGHSQAGTHDTSTAGWVQDSRVKLTYCNDGKTAIGPAVQDIQNGVGHSYELSCGADMAAHYNSNIITAKGWQDGSNALDHLRQPGTMGLPRLAWGSAAIAFVELCRQCRAANVGRIVFFWENGSVESLTTDSVDTPFVLSRTQAIFATYRAIAKAFGIGRVRFYVFQQNINFIGQPNCDPTLLASVRQQEADLVAADPDARLVNCDDIIPASGFHYNNGQTVIIGSRGAALVAQDFADADPGFVTPLTLSDIMGAAWLDQFDSRLGTGVAPGNPISTWTSQTGTGHVFNGPGGSANPTLIANAFTNRDGVVFPGVQGDGVDDKMTGNWAITDTPSVKPFHPILIMRSDSWTGGDRILTGSGGFALRDSTAGSTQTNILNTTQGTSIVCRTGAFTLVSCCARNSNALYNAGGVDGSGSGDFLKTVDASGAVVVSNATTGTNVGNNAPGTLTLLSGSGTFANKTILELNFFNAEPTKVQGDQLLGYFVAKYDYTIGLS